MRLWDTRTRARVATFRVHEDFVADMHHAGARNALLTASGDGTLAVLDLRASKVHARSDNQEDELLSGARPRRVPRCACAAAARSSTAARPTMIKWVCEAPRKGPAVGTHYMLKFLRPRADSSARCSAASACA